MAVIRKWSGDGLTAGTLTTSSAGTGDNAFTSLGGTLNIVATGSRSPQIEAPESSTLARVGWTGLSLASGLAARYYRTHSASATASVAIAQGLGSSGTVQTWRVERIPGGNLRIRDAANAQVGVDSAATVPNSTRIRYEIVVTSAGAITVRAYEADTVNVLAQTSATGVGGTSDAVRFGDAANVTSRPVYQMDDFAVADTAAEIGPIVQASALTSTASVLTTNWTVVPSGTALSVVSDSDDSTLLRSSTNPSSLPLVFKLRPILPPVGDFTLLWKVRRSTDSTSGTATAQIRSSTGTVLATSADYTLTASFVDQPFLFTAASIASITSTQWASGDLQGALVVTAT